MAGYGSDPDPVHHNFIGMTGKSQDSCRMKRKKSRQIRTPVDESVSEGTKPAPVHWLAAGLLVVLCLIVYCNSLSNGFVYDDFGSIVENRYIQQPAKFITALFNHSYFKVAGLEASYRPVATASYFLIYSVI